ncbi:MAG TPA: prepilin-type N-terminal cleavage/methylation domain-containing protein [Solirubrobacteraceae bacterium]|jgi:prepilin-type N-terminal cleavage/methylation domain-containing protein|nr:prepilin-type N-terminal cleavage/methylation domain-containing protein [Solirubrobacteraceae bacterium]
MLSRSRHSARGAQDGFTLVELLVAMSIGLIVMVAVSGFMVFSLHQTQRTFTSVDATRQARTATATIENELHSACVNGDAPIQASSDASTLNFLSYTGGGPNPAPVWHVISFSGGQLTDSVYPAVYTATTTGHSWTQGTPRTSRTTLLTNVAQQPGSVPVFQYYAYAQAYTSGGNAYWYIPDGNNIKPGTTSSTPNSSLTTPLTASLAPTAVEVVVNLFVGPSGENLASSTLTSSFDPITDATSLRLTTPPDYVPSGSGSASYLPCQ